MTKYRLADHKIYGIEGRDFLFLTEDNAIFEMEPEVKEVLMRYAPFQEIDPENFMAGSNGSSAEKKAFFTTLLDRRVIVRPGEEPVGFDGPEKTIVPVNTLVLQVTEACNLDCLYCYRTLSKPLGRAEAMSPDTAVKAVDFLFESCGQLEKLVLVFFGGEPLLNFDLLASTVSYAEAKAKNSGKQIDFAVTTNGSLLNEKIIDFLVTNRVGVTVSLDGFREVHDLFRRFPGGKPSYDMILPKVKQLLTSLEGRPAVARVTLAQTCQHVPQILDHLLDLGFSEVGFAPVTSADKAFQLDALEMERLLAHFRTLAQRFLQTASKGDFLGFTNLVDMLVMLHEGETKKYPCGAGLGLFSVGPDGKLYLCQRLTGEEHFSMGDLFHGLDQVRLENFRKKAAVKTKDACRDCWVRTLCAGGCYHEALTREGSLTAPNLHYCQWIKAWFEVGLDVYSRLVISCPDYLERLSALRGCAPRTYSKLI